MKKILFSLVSALCLFTCGAQTVIDNFTVGPYIVDYIGEGDIKYRLQDNIDLYEFFELQKDTVFIMPETYSDVLHAIQISGNIGSSRFMPKEIGLECVWKQSISKSVYFNGGLSLGFAFSNLGKLGNKRDLFEFGIPLQIELAKIDRQNASCYGIFGLTPKIYSTINAKDWDGSYYTKGIKKSGFMIAPSLEFGGNIPVGNSILRIGVYGTLKFNCTPSDFNVYKNSLGRMYLGAKIGIVI